MKRGYKGVEPEVAFSNELLITKTALYSLVAAVVTLGLATIGLSVSMGVVLANHPANSPPPMPAGSPPTGSPPTGSPPTGSPPTASPLGTPSATPSGGGVEQLHSPPPSPSSSTPTHVYYPRFDNDGLTFTYLTEPMTTTSLDVSAISSVEPTDSDTEKVAQLLQSSHKVKMTSSRPYAVLQNDGSFGFRGMGDYGIFICACFTGNDVCQPFVETYTVNIAYGCLVEDCDSCGGYTMTPDAGQGQVNNGVFVQMVDAGPNAPTNISPDAQGPMTNLNLWSQQSFAAPTQAEVDALTDTIMSAQTVYANELVWTPYQMANDKKAFVLVPQSTLPKDAYYYVGSSGPALQCVGHCAPDDGHSGTCADIYPDNPYVLVCGGCATGCMVEIIN